MYSDMFACRCTIIRGGTSKGIFFKQNDLPSDPVLRDQIILSVFGSPDVRQIDGLGGADVLTSKLAIIAPSARADADIDYTFGQVSFEKAFIDYGGNCGNISSAVGPFAIDEGMVPAVEPVTTVRIHLTNSGKILVAEVPVKNGKAQVEGTCVIDGVPGSGARINMDWSDTAGSACGTLLPTGNAKDIFLIDGKEYPVSLVDMGNPLVFIHANSLGMVGTESPAEIEGNAEWMAVIEQIRGKAAKLFGLVEREQDAAEQSPYAPFFAIVSPPAPYRTLNGDDVQAEEVDLVSRLLFMLKMHKAYPITGTVCTGAAARIPGSVAWEVIPPALRNKPEVRIGHPSGVISVAVTAKEEADVTTIEQVKIFRTARRLMDGVAYVKNSVVK